MKLKSFIFLPTVLQTVTSVCFNAQLGTTSKIRLDLLYVDQPTCEATCIANNGCMSYVVGNNSCALLGLPSGNLCSNSVQEFVKIVAENQALSSSLSTTASTCQPKSKVCNSVAGSTCTIFPQETILLSSSAQMIRLGQNFTVGQYFSVTGVLPTSVDMFNINLLPDTQVPAVNDILQVLVNCGASTVGFYTCINSNWQAGDVGSYNGFQLGGPFDIRVRIMESYYEVRLNGMKFGNYTHRLPYNMTNYFYIGSMQAQSTYLHLGGAVYTVPYTTTFSSESLSLCSQIFVYADFIGDQFTLELLGSSDQVLFMFQAIISQNTVIRNAYVGSAETNGTFPFVLNRAFDLLIVNGPSYLTITANGVVFCTFQHRTANPATDYVKFNIQGSVNLFEYMVY